jgi:endo-1,4-beta-xylanase
MITPELVMKFDAIHPARDSYDFRAADTLVNYAAKNAMQVRGHTLAWHQALPAWLKTGTFSQQELQDIFNKHIQTVVTRYRGQIQQWDVVNEAIGDDGRLRDTFWLQKLGPGYIDQAFKLAHDANPQARLFYNDYGGEGRGYKSDQIYAMVQDMLKRNIPIHGVGLQMHVSLKYPPVLQDVICNMQRLTALGLEVQITEMDVALLDDPRGTDEKFQQQAHIYYNMLSACLSVPNVTAFVMWGFTDRYYWINQGTGLDAPLIFDESYQPKPAYYALRDLLMKSSR